MSLGGVTVRITQGQMSVEAGLFLVSADRVEGWIPAGAPLGSVQVRVTYQERISEPYDLKIVDFSVGPFAGETAPDPLPDAGRVPAGTPGETLALWASGAESGSFEILVGGERAAVSAVIPESCCRGVERVEIRVPRGTPLGCYVPVQARAAGGRMSNAVGVAIHEPGQACRDQVDWFRKSVERATQAGFVVLATVSLQGPVADSSEEYRFDYGLASFGKQESGKRPFPPVPPLHTCTQVTETINFRQVLGQARSPGNWTSIAKPLAGNRRLDAGATLAVSGPHGLEALARDPRRNEYYNALLGGRVPLARTRPAPLFLEPGVYAISGTGGVDVGAFSTKLRAPRPIVWKNRARVREIERSGGVTVEWSGSVKTDAVLIAAGSADRFSGDSALAVCMAPARDGRFAIPAAALSNLPPSGDARDLDSGYLAIAEIPIEPPARIRASGLDSGFAAFVSASARAVTYK